jgi:hypothetical protein
LLRCRIWLAFERGALLILGVGALTAAPALAHAGVVAACGDGSVILAKRWDDVNCAGAIEGAPDDVPPIGSGKKPRPIAWANFLREQEELQRASRRPPVPVNRVKKRAPAVSAVRDESEDRYRSTRPSRAYSRPSLRLTAEERRDLSLLVELSQRSTPAVLEHTRTGAGTAVMQIAHSRAFEAHLHARQRAAGDYRFGPILVFSLEPAGTDLRAAPLSFVQGGPGFSPNVDNPRDFGWIGEGDTRGKSKGRRLGYIVLPESFEVSRPLAVFWGDAVVATTLRR